MEFKNVLQTSIIVKNKNDERIKALKKEYENFDYTFLLNNEDLRQFETKNGLLELQKSTFSLQDHRIISYYEIAETEGFYYESVGYQRKGMNSAFGKRFCSSDTYHFALKEDFQFALSCVDFYWTEDTEDDLKQRKQNFNTNFLDKYEYGASFLTVSY